MIDDPREKNMIYFSPDLRPPVKYFAKIKDITQGQLVLDAVEPVGLETMRLAGERVVTGKIEAHFKIISRGWKIPVVVQLELMRAEDELERSDLKLDIDDIGEIATPGWMFDIGSGQLASTEHVADSLYIERSDQLLRLVTLDESWQALAAWLGVEMRSRLSNGNTNIEGGPCRVR